MTNFNAHMSSATTDSGKKGWLVSILELGAWFGVLCTGYLADKLSRKYTIVLGTHLCSLRPGDNVLTEILYQRLWYSVSASLFKVALSIRPASMAVVSLLVLG